MTEILSIIGNSYALCWLRNKHKWHKAAIILNWREIYNQFKPDEMSTEYMQFQNQAIDNSYFAFHKIVLNAEDITRRPRNFTKDCRLVLKRLCSICEHKGYIVSTLPDSEVSTCFMTLLTIINKNIPSTVVSTSTKAFENTCKGSKSFQYYFNN